MDIVTAHDSIIRLRRIHEMQAILTNDRGVCLTVCRAKKAERNKVLFGVNTPGAQGTLC